MRALLISGIGMAIAAVIIAVAYWGFGMTPVDLLDLALNIVGVGDPLVCKPIQVKE